MLFRSPLGNHTHPVVVSDGVDEQLVLHLQKVLAADPVENQLACRARGRGDQVDLASVGDPLIPTSSAANPSSAFV